MTHTAIATPLHRLQATSTPPDDLFATQLQREQQQKKRSEDRERTNQRRLREMGKESCLRYGRALFQATQEKLKVELDRRFEEAVIRPEMARAFGSVYPLFDAFDSTDQVAAVGLIAAVDQLSRQMKRTAFCRFIGSAIERESRLIRLRQRAPLVQRKLFKSAMTRTQVASKETLRKLNCPCPEWSAKTRVLVGEFLLEAIITATGMFKVEKRKAGRHMAHMVLATDDALAFVKAVRPGEANTIYGPMVSRPRPWADVWTGGTLTNDEPLIRVNGQEGARVEETVRRLYVPADLSVIFKAVNHLQGVQLQVDGEMVQNCRIAWDNGIEGLYPCGRVPLAVPERLGHDPDPEALKVRNRLAAAAHRDQEQNRHVRISIERSIQSAEEMKGRSLFQAYRLDHRGRFYAVNRTCTHQGQDHEKAALSFEPAPVGEEGIEWILKAAAGHYGLSRDTWEARLTWGRQNHERLLAAAADPLGRLELWRSAKDPWQFLQLCKGYKEALETGATGVPIRLDQTTSGLGILSALLRLEGPGRLCNIYGKTPSDLYSVVAEGVTKALLSDLELGDEKQRGLAQMWLEIGVERSLIKGPVLAQPYGGMYQGVADSVVDFLDKRYGYVPLEQFIYKVSTPSKYLASLIWREMKPFTDEPMAVKKWLRAVAKTAMTQDQPLRWTTPAGVPVESADRMALKKDVYTLLFGKLQCLSLRETPADGKLNYKAAAKTITANYVHSFDAALVGIVSSCAADHNIPLLCNHDCFATTPTRASELHNLLLTSFAGLYRTDWLEVHHQEMEALTGLSLPKPPARQGLGVGLIGTNPYLFS